MESNSVLLEPSFLKSINCLEANEKMSFRHFLDLCSLVEAIVLHDKIYTFGVRRTYYRLPFLRTLRDQGIMNFFIEEVDHVRASIEQHYSVEAHAYSTEIERNEMNRRMQRYALWISSFHTMPYVPSVESKNTIVTLYETDLFPEVESLIRSFYQKVENSFNADLKRLKASGRPVNLVIPPIMLLILTKTDRPQGILEEALCLRHEYSRLRKRFAEYESIIRDETVPIDKAVKQIRKIERDSQELASLLESQDQRILFEAADIFKETPKHIFDPTRSVEPNELVRFLLNKPLDWIVKWHKKRKLSYFLSLKKKLERIKKYNQLVNKTFGYDFAESEISEVATSLKDDRKG